MNWVMCERCQGNGEIVTSWERYLAGQPEADNALVDCPDCDGRGSYEDEES